jgi:ABC-2 type transport system permease protein
MMTYYVDLYLTYFRLLLKAWSQYRVDFVISIVASILHDGSVLLFLTTIFANVRQLEGWSFHETLLTWGLAMVCRNLANGLFDVPHRIHMYVQSGELDRLLVRPLEPLIQIAGERGITLPALGRALVGVIAILAILPELQLPWWGALYLPLAVISGVLIMFSMQLLISCLSFWFTNTVSVLSTATWMYQFGQYPVTIFALPLRLVLTWVLPYAMMGFYPAAFLLRGGEYRLYGLLVPLMALLFLGLSLSAWRVGLGHYQSTGS